MYDDEETGKRDMPWPEFCRLLSGIDHRTPLGRIVSIRMEEDRDILKHFTKGQHRIRNEWRAQHSTLPAMTEEEKEKATQQVQNIFVQMFG